jgi:PAS domain S-box-containing protein
MPELLSTLFASAPFMPHGYCYLWKPGLVWLHILSDSIIALSYYSIPLTLLFFVRKRQDLPFNWIFLLFGTFIVACGTTHLMEIWTLWHPTYWLSGALKAVTALASFYTALALVSLVPKALVLPSLAATNEKLEQEIIERQQVVEELRKSLKELSDIKFALDQSAIVAMTDRQGTIHYVNDKFCKLSKYSQEELIGQNHSLINSGYHSQEFFKTLWTTIAQGQVWHGEIRNRAKDGQYYWVDTTIVPFLNDQGLPFQYWAIRFDITERKQAEESLLRYAQRIEGMNRIDREILAQQSSKDTAQVALWHLRRLVPCQCAAVVLFNVEQDKAEIVAGDADKDLMSDLGVDGLGSDGFFLPLATDSIADALSDTAVYSVEDVAALDHPSPTMQRLLVAGIHSYMVAPLMLDGAVIGELKLADTRPTMFNHEHTEIASEVAAQLALAIQKARLFEQTRADRERLQTLSTRLMEAQETERRHLARELHDEIGQALTAVKINLQSVPQSADGSSAALQDSISIVEIALQQVRNLSLDLRPSLLDDLGLVAALRWYVDRYAQRSGVMADFSGDASKIQASPTIETACFRIVQEALTNALRHAQARHVSVELQQRDHTLHLLIHDDGLGFDVPAARERATKGGSLGLLGMEERALLVGGQLKIKSVPQQGTEIDVRLPAAVA